MISITEYEKITCNKEAADVHGYTYIAKAIFQVIEAFILEVEDVNDFLTIQMRRHVGKLICAKNYVGVLQINDEVQIEILPKIDRCTNIDARKITLNMLQTLLNFKHKTFRRANIHAEKMPIFDVFIRLFIEDVQRVVKHGLKSSYYEVEDNLRVLKGKLLFTKQMQHNYIHKERFYVQYDEFGSNRPENRLLKTTLDYVLKRSMHQENSKMLRQLLAHFDGVPFSANIAQDFSSVQLTRHMQQYEEPLRWAQLFLQQKSMTASSGSEQAQSLLFPMEQLFESYVSKLLQNILYASNWKISLQDRSHYLFHNRFQLRPDIVLENDARKIVMDTKWKILQKNRSENDRITAADMYQMYAYAKKYKTNEIIVLYPQVAAFEEGETLQFISDDGVRVNIVFLNCLHMEQSLQTFVEKIEEGTL